MDDPVAEIITLKQRVNYLHDCIAKLFGAILAFAVAFGVESWNSISSGNRWSWWAVAAGAAAYVAAHIFASRYWKRLGGDDW